MSKQYEIKYFMELYLITIPLLFANFLVFIFYICLATAYKGKTIGKHLTGIRVCNEFHNNITDKRSLFRHTIGMYVAFYLLGIGILWIKVDKMRQGWHDKVSRTYVIYENKKMVRIGVFSVLTLFAIYYLLFMYLMINLYNNPLFKPVSSRADIIFK